MFNPRLIAGAIALGALPAFALAATPVIPDAGQTTRELQPTPSIQAPRETSARRVEKSPDDSGGNGVRFRVDSIRIEGNAEFSTAELHKIVADLEGSEHNLSELRQAAARITDYYRQQGYAIARAYLPPQKIEDGVITIGVIEGHLAQRRIDNKSRLSNEHLDAYFKRMKEGTVIRSADVDRSLLLLGDVPGVGGSHAALQPGASVGTSDLLVDLSPAPAVSGNGGVDNYGNRYTGEYRAAGTLNFNSPLRMGDQLRFTALTAGSDLLYGRAAYQLPLGGDGLQMGAAYFYVRYRLGREFKSLDAGGNARGGSLFAGYPLIRSQNANLSATLAVEGKDLSDEVNATHTVTDKRVRSGSLGLSGSLADKLLGGGRSSFYLTAVRGRLDIDSSAARTIDAASARTAGQYTRFSYSASRLQSAGRNLLLSLSFSGQQASKNLDTSEKFALGGVTGVRAYPQGEGIGDEGYLWNAELRYDINRWLQAMVFYDAGSVTLNDEPFGPPGANHRKLAGAGIGMNANVFGVRASAVLAWPTTGGDPVSIPANATRSALAWVQASIGF